MSVRPVICSGTYTETQKRLFGGFPLSTMSPQACGACGTRTYPQRRGTDWTPKMHYLPVIGPLVIDPLVVDPIAR